MIYDIDHQMIYMFYKKSSKMMIYRDLGIWEIRKSGIWESAKSGIFWGPPPDAEKPQVTPREHLEKNVFFHPWP